MNRRKFIRNSTATLAGFYIVPSRVLGGNKYIAPSDQLTKAIIGVAGMGRSHISYSGANLIAICDVDKSHLKSALGLSPKGTKTYHDYRELLQNPAIDIVHIVTPPHWFPWPLLLFKVQKFED